MRADVPEHVLTHAQREHWSQENAQPGRCSVREKTAQMLSRDIVRLYRLTGWPPARVALELASATRGSRRDVLRWARDGVPRSEREALFDRIADLCARHEPEWPWDPSAVRSLLEDGWSRLDLAIEADLTVERVKQLERGSRPSRAEAARIREAAKEGSDDA